MARLRIETAPEVTIYDEAFVVKAASGATAPLVQFKDSSGSVVGNITTTGVLNVSSVVAASAGSSSTDLATRGYVDAIAAGTSWHQSVALATTAALPSCTYGNGSSGVGATLTATANGALVIDTQTPEVGYSILVKDQATATQNGIYSVTAIGSEGAAWVLTRRSDSDNSPEGEVKAGDAVYVVTGSENLGQSYVITSSGTGTGDQISLGTDNITYSIFAGTNTTQPGTGLVRASLTLNVATASNNRIVVNSDDIDLANIGTPTQSSGSNTVVFIDDITVDTYGRTTAYRTSSVDLASYAPLASPALTGTPTSPTAAGGTNDTQIATTSFVETRAAAAESNAASAAANVAAAAESNAASAAANVHILKSVFDNKGDLLVGSANDTSTRIGVGADGLFLKTNSSAAVGVEWASIPSINTLDDVGDVTITSASSGEFLKWNGSAWVNDSIPTINTLDDVGDVTITSASSGQFLKWNGSAWINDAVPVINDIDDITGVTLTSVAANQVFFYNGSAWINTSDPTIGGNLSVTGNLTVSGTTTTVNSETLTIDDNIIVLNNNASGAPTENAGVEIERGSSNNVQLRWNETTDCWEFTNDGTNYQRIITDTITNEQTASYTLALADTGKMVEMNVASANTLTVPPNSSVAFPVGATLTVLQTAAGQCTLTAGAGVTINGTPGLKLRAEWSSATLVKRATDTWVAIGDLAA